MTWIVCCMQVSNFLSLLQVVYGCRNDRFGGCGSILSIHENGCGGCGGCAPVDWSCQSSECHLVDLSASVHLR